MVRIQLTRGMDGSVVDSFPANREDPVTGLQILGRILASKPDNAKPVPGQLDGLLDVQAALEAADLLKQEMSDVPSVPWKGQIYRGRPANESHDSSTPPPPAWFDAPPVEVKGADRFNGFRQYAWYVATSDEVVGAEVWQGGEPVTTWAHEFEIELDKVLDLRPKARAPFRLLNAAATLASVSREEFKDATDVQLLRLIRDVVEEAGWQGILYPSIQTHAQDKTHRLCLVVWDETAVADALARPVGEPFLIEP